MLQVGILWGDINHGFPFSIVLGATIGQEVSINPYRSEIDPADAASIIFNPYRVTICDGGRQTQKTQRAHYLVSRKSDLFESINTRCMSYYEDIMIVAPEPDIPVDRWGDLVSERSVLIEFRAIISQDIIKWLFDRNNTAPGAPSEIKKLLIIPEENAGKQSVCLYVLTNDRIVRVVSPSANYYDTQKMISDSLLLLSGNTGNTDDTSDIYGRLSDDASIDEYIENVSYTTANITESDPVAGATQDINAVTDIQEQTQSQTAQASDAAQTSEQATQSEQTAGQTSERTTQPGQTQTQSTQAVQQSEQTQTEQTGQTQEQTEPTQRLTGPTAPDRTEQTQAEQTQTGQTHIEATLQTTTQPLATVQTQTPAEEERTAPDERYAAGESIATEERTEERESIAAAERASTTETTVTTESTTADDRATTTSGNDNTTAATPQANTDAGNIRYKTINEVGGGRFPDFSPDVFCIVEGPKTNDFRRIRYTAPAEVRDKSELEQRILASDIYSYNRSIDYNDTIVFKNITSIYRLYKDGFMEYNYIPLTQPGEKGGVAASLENAIAYIINIERQLLGSADLILSGIYENESDLTYKFTFDYIIDDYPVHFLYEQLQGEMVTEYQNAITVYANANRVVSCRWMFVDLFFATDTKKMQIYFDKIEVGQSLTRMAVSDIAVAYFIDMTGKSESYDELQGYAYYEWPVWAITSPDGSVQTVRLSEG